MVEGEKRVRVETGDVTRTAKIIFNLSNDLVVATNGHGIKENKKEDWEIKG